VRARPSPLHIKKALASKWYYIRMPEKMLLAGKSLLSWQKGVLLMGNLPGHVNTRL